MHKREFTSAESNKLSENGLGIPTCGRKQVFATASELATNDHRTSTRWLALTTESASLNSGHSNEVYSSTSIRLLNWSVHNRTSTLS